VVRWLGIGGCAAAPVVCNFSFQHLLYTSLNRKKVGFCGANGKLGDATQNRKFGDVADVVGSKGRHRSLVNQSNLERNKQQDIIIHFMLTATPAIGISASTRDGLSPLKTMTTAELLPCIPFHSEQGAIKMAASK